MVVSNNVTYAMLAIKCTNHDKDWITIGTFEKPAAKSCVLIGYYNSENIELQIDQNILQCAGGKAGDVYNVTIVFPL